LTEGEEIEDILEMEVMGTQMLVVDTQEDLIQELQLPVVPEEEAVDDQSKQQ